METEGTAKSAATGRNPLLALVHDLNNAMTVTNGYASMLLEGRHRVTPKQREMIARIHKAGQVLKRRLLNTQQGILQARLDAPGRRRAMDRIRQQVNALSGLTEESIGQTDLAAAHPEAGAILQSAKMARQIVEDELEPRIERVHIRTLAQRLKQDNEGAWPGCQVTLKVQPDLRVSGVESMIVRSFQNIIQNAFQNGATHVVIRATRSRPNSQLDVAHAAVRITDNGPGIEKWDLPDIFSPAFTRRPEGTGMGLASVKRAIHEKHGGYVDARSRVRAIAEEKVRTRAKGGSQTGHGSTFEMRIPIAYRGPLKAPEPLRPRRPRHPLA